MKIISFDKNLTSNFRYFLILYYLYALIDGFIGSCCLGVPGGGVGV